MQARKPVWKTSSYLVYAGGLTVLVAAIAALTYLSGHYGKGALTGWGALILVVLYALAHWFRRRGRWTAAGIFAFASVIAWAVFLGLAWEWFGWLHASASFKDFSIARLALELLVLVAAWDDRRRFGFPLITLISATVGWFFVIDLVSSGGTWTKVVTLLVGLAYLLAGVIGDSPSTFWLHLVSGLLIGGVFLDWWHSSDTDWALISAASLIYVGLAYSTKRSTWAVLGSVGFLGATFHYLFGSATTTAGLPIGTPSISGWAPSVAFACLGFWYVLLGLATRRRRTG
ncbi:MAG TPA: hypothetical protein VN770_11260 [Gaiellaceae bacterium]|nr:hypothetical protein [Gaiellaceae bacterium]